MRRKFVFALTILLMLDLLGINKSFLFLVQATNSIIILDSSNVEANLIAFIVVLV